MPRPFDVNRGLRTALPNRSTAAVASATSSVIVVSGDGGGALQEAHALQEDVARELEVRHDAPRRDERARLGEREPRLEVVVADQPGELAREVAHQIVHPPQLGGQVPVLDRGARVRY